MSTKEQYSKFRTVIIGGGVAGISAAYHLACHGITDLVILESKGRLGGRIHTLNHENRPLELGAQWIKGGCPANSMYNLGNSFNLFGDEVQRLNDCTGSSEDTLHWPLTRGYIYKSNGFPISEEASKQAYDIFNAVREEILNYHKQNVSKISNKGLLKTRLLTFYNSRMRKAMEGLTKDFPKSVLDEIEVALSGLRNAVALIAGDDLENVKLELIGASANLPGGHVVVPNGMDGFIKAMTSRLPDKCIRLNRRVTLVDWSLLSRNARDMDKVYVECVTPEGFIEEYHADVVISTLPLGVMRRLHQQIFYPGLTHEKINAMQTIGIGHLAKLYFEWKEPWWAPGEGGITLAWSNPEMKSRVLPTHWERFITNFAEVDYQPDLLSCMLAGSGARVVDQLEDTEIIDKIANVLKTFTGDHSIPKPSKIFRDSWSLDPDAYGSLCYPQISTDEIDFATLSKPLPSDRDPRVLFAGEATEGRHFGTLQGARNSGIREANRVIERFEKMNTVAQELQKLSFYEL